MNFEESFPRIGIYVGEGASHSWIWLAETLDRRGIHRVAFLKSEEVICSEKVGKCGVLFLSGGDPFTIARALGVKGAEVIRRYVSGGGLYVGVCAGAYLPLRSSHPDLAPFNMVNAKVSNIAKEDGLPPPRALPTKFKTQYDHTRCIYHPFRGEVEMIMSSGGKVRAPLYGGPALLPFGDIEPLFYYLAPTQRTHFLSDRSLASSFWGKIAVAKKRYGDGSIYLFGPHFEHPKYKTANEVLIRIFKKASRGGNEELPSLGCDVGAEFSEIKKVFSNCRLVARSLEWFDVSWPIGRKYYEPVKIAFFAESIWGKIKSLEGVPGLCFSRVLVEKGEWLLDCLRLLKRKLAEQEDAVDIARETLSLLKDLTVEVYNYYFRTRTLFTKNGG